MNGLIACQIQDVNRLATDILGITLALDTDSFSYRPGQYIDLVLADGARRSFSIASGTCTSKTIDVHVREVTSSQFIANVLETRGKPGCLAIAGPFGELYYRGAPEVPGSAIILMASGTGFSSIKAIMEALLESGSQHPIYLYWGGRCGADLYLRTWVEQVMKAMPGLSFIPVLSAPEPQDRWTGRSGNVHQAVMADFPDMRNCHIYACGAPIVVESARRDFSDLCGLPKSQFVA
ncbi:FAD-binding oxidoreductase [Pseudomonas sp. NPDC087697]|uniref:FAD-binding oxidoreductase n=1 Tax=Pseudomonas sp. NPDC087697 TaxID=3364447 RepID=UPI003826C8C0